PHRTLSPQAAYKAPCTRQAEPRTAVARLITQALERLEHAVSLIRRDPRALVDDPQVDALADGAGVDPDGPIGRGPGDCVVDDVRDGAFEERGVGLHSRPGLVDANVDESSAIPESFDRGGHNLFE